MGCGKWHAEMVPISAKLGRNSRRNPMPGSNPGQPQFWAVAQLVRAPTVKLLKCRTAGIDSSYNRVSVRNLHDVLSAKELR